MYRVLRQYPHRTHSRWARHVALFPCAANVPVHAPTQPVAWNRLLCVYSWLCFMAFTKYHFHLLGLLFSGDTKSA